MELRDINIYPNETVLEQVLGPAYEAYQQLIELFQKHQMTYEWRYYKDSKAWLCKVEKKKKTIVWASAWNEYIQASIYFPLTLVDKILELDIDEGLKEKINNTANAGKLKPCIFEIRSKEILNDFEKVMELKLSLK